MVSTMFPRTYPPGLTTEILSKNLLKTYEKRLLILSIASINYLFLQKPKWNKNL